MFGIFENKSKPKLEVLEILPSGNVMLEVHLGISLKPEFSCPGFVETNKCEDCELVGRDIDIPTFSPCINCGGQVRKYEPGKYIYKEKRWMTRKEFMRKEYPEKLI